MIIGASHNTRMIRILPVHYSLPATKDQGSCSRIYPLCAYNLTNCGCKYAELSSSKLERLIHPWKLPFAVEIYVFVYTRHWSG